MTFDALELRYEYMRGLCCTQGLLVYNNNNAVNIFLSLTVSNFMLIDILRAALISINPRPIV
jgi:hypothetical protein